MVPHYIEAPNPPLGLFTTALWLCKDLGWAARLAPVAYSFGLLALVFQSRFAWYEIFPRNSGPPSLSFFLSFFLSLSLSGPALPSSVTMIAC